MTSTDWTVVTPHSTDFVWNFLLQENGDYLLQETDYKLRISKTWTPVEHWS